MPDRSRIYSICDELCTVASSLQEARKFTEVLPYKRTGRAVTCHSPFALSYCRVNLRIIMWPPLLVSVIIVFIIVGSVAYHHMAAIRGVKFNKQRLDLLLELGAGYISCLIWFSCGQNEFLNTYSRWSQQRVTVIG